MILLKSANAKGCIAQVPILVSRRQTATFDENYQSEREKKKNGEWFFRLSAAVKSGIFRAPSSARRISQEPITAEEMKFIETSILKDW